MESVSAQGTQRPRRGALAEWCATSGVEAAAVKSRPSCSEIWRRASGRPGCDERIQEPAVYSVLAEVKARSAISILKFESRKRAARRLSWPESFKRNTGPEPETLPWGCGASVRSVSGAERTAESSVGRACT